MGDGMMAETVTIAGHGGDEIEAYLGFPTDEGRYGGVVVIHHMPGYDRPTKEIVRTFAVGGYSALLPNLYHRIAPGAKPNDAAKLAIEAGGVSDEQCMGDLKGAADHLRALPSSNGKVGVIGYCSGGRQAYVAACLLDFDAAVDCYGGRVVAAPEELTPLRPVAPIDLTPKMNTPLLGLFGAKDSNPDPDQVAKIEAALKAHGKEYEFHTYPEAGHAFFSVDRDGYYNVDATREGWKRIWDFFGRHLASTGG
ncbi:MAG: dienelactone hydrolase family protein [Acidimicrobiia bacterium]